VLVEVILGIRFRLKNICNQVKIDCAKVNLEKPCDRLKIRTNRERRDRQSGKPCVTPNSKYRVQGRLVGLAHFTIGYILTYAAFLIASTATAFG
jgi:hypothetical protein